MRRATMLLLLATGCASNGAPSTTDATTPAPPPFDATPFVDPFIGTGGHGHTFPGATVPFGMVQLSPDTRLDGWDGCSGYHHDDEFVYGFSHTHLSGTGCSDYGDILLMPGVGDVDSRGNGLGDDRHHFSHANETASAGYYSVLLDDAKVRAELTATTRVGLHRYTFPPGTKDAHVLIDLAHRDEVIESSIWTSSDCEVRGFRRSRAWAQDQHVYFVARFSRPFLSQHFVGHEKFRRAVGSKAGQDVNSVFGFDVSDGAPLVVKVGISAVDVDGAAKNLDAECPGFDFDAVRDAARETWRKQLGKIEVHGGSDAQLRTFYTALYHCCIAPNVFSDVDGRYRGRDMKIHEAKGWTQYTVFSLWDTFRALHPLMTILEPARTNDWINTFLAQYREGGALPVWELAANETNCMIGYHAVPVIADAYAKGIRGYDANAALDAMVASANRDVRGLPSYRKYGFVPADEEGESVSKTLEYAYDDWCISEMASALGRHEVGSEFGTRAQSWINLFDPKTQFMRPRRNDTWIEPFDPAEVNNHLTEANTWQYTFFVPHQSGLLAIEFGGSDALAAKLDALFAAESRTKGRDQADISGMIGQYAHGNEPSHHMAYLYDFVGQPWKTQQRVRQILDTLYSDKPDGLCGNEDCGQMSAWYVLSALGFYPVCPGTPEYAIGTPLFREAKIHVNDSHTFVIRTDGPGPYVQSATLDGRPLGGPESSETPFGDPFGAPSIAHAAILRGGSLDFAMGLAPSQWGRDAAMESQRGSITPVPFVVRGDRVFTESTEIELGVLLRIGGGSVRWNDEATSHPNFEHVDIMFSLNGGPFERYQAPFRIDATTDLVVYGNYPGMGFSSAGIGGPVRGKSAHARFAKIPHDGTLTLAHPYAPQYAANGDRTLIDGLRGGGDWRTGDWQGFQGDDIDATIDLGAEREITAVRAGFIQDVGSWIWWPTEFSVSTSADGKTFAELGAVTNTSDEHDSAVKALVFEVPRKVRARYVRVVGKNRGACPAWHPGAGHKAWLFADEIGIDVSE